MFLRRLTEGRPAIGYFAFLPSPATVEILALAGFDFVMIDREHSPKDWSVLENMIRAAEARHVPALVRVSKNDPSEILHALESGADGIVVPGVTSADEAVKAVRAMRYPPEGARGSCPQARTSSYGALRYSDHTKDANESRALLLLIEHSDCVREVATIAKAAGPRVSYMVGRSDLAASIGHSGQPTHPEVVGLARQFITDVKSVAPDAPIGMGLYSEPEIAEWWARGCKFFWYGADISILMNAARTAVDAMKMACAMPQSAISSQGLARHA